MIHPSFSPLFHFRDELAKGRTCTICSAIMVSMITWLTTGLFYTGAAPVLTPDHLKETLS